MEKEIIKLLGYPYQFQFSHNSPIIHGWLREILRGWGSQRPNFKGKYEAKLEFGEVGGRGELILKNHLWWEGIFSGNTYSRHSNFSSFPKLYSNSQEFLQSCRMPWSGSW